MRPLPLSNLLAVWGCGSLMPAAGSLEGGAASLRALSRSLPFKGPPPSSEPASCASAASSSSRGASSASPATRASRTVSWLSLPGPQCAASKQVRRAAGVGLCSSVTAWVRDLHASACEPLQGRPHNQGISQEVTSELSGTPALYPTPKPPALTICGLPQPCPELPVLQDQRAHALTQGLSVRAGSPAQTSMSCQPQSHARSSGQA